MNTVAPVPGHDLVDPAKEVGINPLAGLGNGWPGHRLGLGQGNAGPAALFPQFGEDNVMAPGPGGRHQAEDRQDDQEAVQRPVPFCHVPVMGACQFGDLTDQGLPHGHEGIVGSDLDSPGAGLGLTRFFRAPGDVPEVAGEWLDMDVLGGFGPSARFFPGRLADYFPVGSLVGSTVETGGIDKGLDQHRPALVTAFPFTGQSGCRH